MVWAWCVRVYGERNVWSWHVCVYDACNDEGLVQAIQAPHENSSSAVLLNSQLGVN